MSQQLELPPPRSTALPPAVGVGTVLRAVRHYPLTSAAAVLLACGAAYLVWTYLPLPKMTAYAILQVRAQPDYVTQAVGDAKVEFGVYRQSQAALVKSRLVLDAALSQPEVAALPVVRAQGGPVNWLEGQLKVDFKLGPELMRVTMEGDNEHDLRRIVAAVTDTYLKDVVNRDNARRLAQLERLNRVYRKLDETLAGYRARIRTLAETLGTTEPAGVAAKERYIQEEIGACRKELSQLERDVLRAKSDAQVYRAAVAAGSDITVPEAEVVEAIRADPQYRKLADEEARSTSVLDELRGSFAAGVQHPTVAAKERELARLKADLSAYAERIRPRVVARLKEARLAREREQLEAVLKRIDLSSNYQTSLEGRLEALDEETRTFKSNQVDLDQVKAEFAQTEKMAARILGEIEALKPELETVGRVALWEEPAVVPGTDGNRRLKYTLMAGLGALLAGLGLVTGIEYRSRRITQSGDVAGALGLRVLGTVPALSRRARHRPTTPEPAGIAEAVDNARTLLLGGIGDERARTLMVTSALSGEGKSFLSAHLAVSLARAGHRVLLVDGDMRRPTLHRVLGVELSPGLSDVLRGTVGWREAVRVAPAAGVTLLPAGRFHPALPRALAGDGWGRLHAELAAEFDFVIVDTTPVLPVPDTLLMARHVDGVILSVMNDVSRQAAVAETKERLAAVGTRVLGAVINGVRGEGYYGYYHARDPYTQAAALPDKV